MATINKGILSKYINEKIEYIYPKTCADLVEYDVNQNVKDKIDSIVTNTDATINDLSEKVLLKTE